MTVVPERPSCANAGTSPRPGATAPEDEPRSVFRPPLTADVALRETTVRLQALLDETIAQIAGPESLAEVQTLRALVESQRRGGPAIRPETVARLEQLSETDRRVVTRAMAICLDLMNVAEDRQRVRILRERERAAHPASRAESIRAALAQLAAEGRTAAEVQELLDRLDLELVLTAHPTEAKRRSIRSKLRQVRELVQQLDDADLLPREVTALDRQLRAELTKLWQTDFIRPWRPTVMQEVQRALSIMPVLWRVVPAMFDDLRQAVRAAYPQCALRVAPFLRFASWIGGDRDGHPGVTAEITAQTLVWLRRIAVGLHRDTCCDLFGSLSLSARQAPVSDELRQAVAAAEQNWPEAAGESASIPPNETYRRWLAIIDWRLRRAGEARPSQPPPTGAYRSAQELEHDVLVIQRSLNAAHSGLVAVGEIQRWLDQIRVFGLHAARLDVRQDARHDEAVLDELLARAGVAPNFAGLSEAARQRLLTETLGRPLTWDAAALSDAARETIDAAVLLRRTLRHYGPEALGGRVISMTRQPSDVLTVLWWWEWSRSVDGGDARDAGLRLPIVPLFETIDYLTHAAETMTTILDNAAYRSYLRSQADRQTVMIGYSDSTKDGGYLAACWALYRAQVQIHDTAAQRGVQVTFFHGRGGSLGRGGGPTARAILSLPPKTFRGSLRLTEQGEVLAERYDDPHVAYRHLEQVTWSALLASTRPDADTRRWEDTLNWLAERSLRAYHGLIRKPGFVEFFRLATPIGEIERLPIGSRPSRRKAGGSLADLRAIPWVFSWTQIRCLVPAWYGLGAAAAALRAELPERWRDLADMYRQWPFFRAIVDNAVLALAKTDLTVVEQYLQLAEQDGLAQEFGPLIAAEYRDSCAAVLHITGQPELLADLPWLQESIRRRSPYVDLLNLIQVDLLRRLRSAASAPDEPAAEEWAHLVRLTIQGIAAGMRTTG